MQDLSGHRSEVGVKSDAYQELHGTERQWCQDLQVAARPCIPPKESWQDR